MNEKGPESSPIVAVHNLTMNYGDKLVLRDVSFNVFAGQILGYIGPNGAGKTTTVKILTGMLDGFGGSATVCGHDVSTDQIEVKRRIGYIPESAVLYDTLTPREYLRFIGQIHGLKPDDVEERTAEMLALFDLADVLDERLATFSKGMRQKTLIAAALIHNPQVIFLDEPLSGLDAHSVVIVKEIIARLAQHGKAIFYCSHVMDVVERICDRIMVISEGRIIADGTFEQLRKGGRASSLESIVTQLTSAGGQTQVAEKFVQIVERAHNHG